MLYDIPYWSTHSGKVDYLLRCTLHIVCWNRLSWSYDRGTSASSSGGAISSDELGFWEVLARATPDILFRAVEEMARQRHIPMPV